MTPTAAGTASRAPASLVFLGASLSAPAEVGALTPSGPGLVRGLVAPVRERAGLPVRVLEVGAGTGAVTQALVGLVGAGGHLDVVEPHRAFHPVLEALADKATASVAVHACAIQDFTADEAYDVIISGLPFYNMGPRTVRAILGRYRQLARPGATITWFSYRGTYRARRMTAAPALLDRHRQVRTVLTDAGGSDYTVWANVPPARVTRIHVPV